MPRRAMAAPVAMALLGLLLVAAMALRVWLAPRPTDLETVFLALRGRIALAAVVLGAGAGLAAVAAQAQAREASIDATLAGPAWGALPALLMPIPLAGQALVAVAGAWLVTRITGRGTGGLPMVLARGVAVGGAVVALAALLLFLGPGLTPTTALAFIHAAVGGALPRATSDRILVAFVLCLAGLVVGLVGWRGLLLARTGLAPPTEALHATLALGIAGSVLVGGVAPGLGLLGARAARTLIGEHPATFLPAAGLATATVALALDGLGAWLAWPGELPVGILTALVASGLVAWRVVPR